MSSDKIKSKDLSYDSSLPPFLQRLHAQNAGRGDTDRHERQLARPRKPRESNEDDGPTVVDESGENVSKEEYEKLTKTTSSDNSTAVTGKTDLATEPKASGALSNDANGDSSDKRADSSITDGVSHKKRKAAKIIGNDEATGKGQKDPTITPKNVKKPRKAKVKLTFDDDEED